MPSNINTVLADCEQKAKELLAEIQKYQAAGALSDQAAKSLNALCQALEETHHRIMPFTETNIRRFLVGLSVYMVVNIGLLIAVLILVFKR